MSDTAYISLGFSARSIICQHTRLSDPTSTGSHAPILAPARTLGSVMMLQVALGNQVQATRQ